MDVKERVQEICKLLGVEVEEMFYLRHRSLNPKYAKNKIIYKIDGYGLLLCGYNRPDSYCWCISTDVRLDNIISGEYIIENIPYMPKMGDDYWTFGLDNKCHWIVEKQTWEGFPMDYAWYKAGWTFRTKEAAEIRLKEVEAELYAAEKEQ